MNITILGAGNMGTGYGAVWAAAGHTITYSYSRSEEKLRTAAEGTGHGAGYDIDPANAARDADVIVLTVGWAQLDDVLAKLGPVPDTLVIDAFTPLKPDMSGLAVGHTTSGAEVLAARLPDSRVVMALQNTFAEVVHAPTRAVGGQTPSMFFCGDDPGAKKTVAVLITDAGYEPVDAGPLTVARHLEPVCFFTVQLAYQQHLGPVALKLLAN